VGVLQQIDVLVVVTLLAGERSLPEHVLAKELHGESSLQVSARPRLAYALKGKLLAPTISSASWSYAALNAAGTEEARLAAELSSSAAGAASSMKVFFTLSPKALKASACNRCILKTGDVAGAAASILSL
jgi:hypothetical protein